MVPVSLPFLTWFLALAGAVFALGAVLGKSRGILSKTWGERLLGFSYGLMGLSIALFIVRGFSE
jgi:hypothetical protein